MTTDQKIIKNRLGLLELAKQLGNVSQACKILGYSRDSFYRYKELHETGGETALADISKKKPIVKNRMEPHVEEAVVEMAIGRTDCRRRVRFFAIEDFRKRIKPHAIARRGSRLNSPLTAKCV